MNNTKSIYKNVEFQDEPYSSNNKFAVYVPKQDVPRYSQTQQMFTSQQQQNQQSKTQRVEFKDEQQENNNIQNIDIPQQDYHQQQNEQIKIENHRKGNVTQNRYRMNYQSPKTAQIQHSQKFYSSTPSQSIQKQRTLQQFKDSLYFDERINKVPKSTIRNHIIDSIVSDADLLLQKKELMTSIYKLKQLNLLKNKEFAQNRLPGVGKSSFVYNDYHTKSTNNGYSRNFGGVFYTR